MDMCIVCNVSPSITDVLDYNSIEMFVKSDVTSREIKISEFSNIMPESKLYNSKLLLTCLKV